MLFLARTVRFGEMAALRVGGIDFLRRRAVIAESVTLVGSQQVWGTPKGHERREVPLPGFLVDELAAHVKGKAPDDLVFAGVRGGGARCVPRSSVAPPSTAPPRPSACPGCTRTSSGTLLPASGFASGADVKVVQQMLRHKSATMTLDQYGHLFEHRLDEVADRLDKAARASADVYPLCTRAEIVDLDHKRRSSAAQ